MKSLQEFLQSLSPDITLPNPLPHGLIHQIICQKRIYQKNLYQHPDLRATYFLEMLRYYKAGKPRRDFALTLLLRIDSELWKIPSSKGAMLRHPLYHALTGRFWIAMASVHEDIATVILEKERFVDVLCSPLYRHAVPKLFLRIAVKYPQFFGTFLFGQLFLGTEVFSSSLQHAFFRHPNFRFYMSNILALWDEINVQNDRSWTQAVGDTFLLGLENLTQDYRLLFGPHSKENTVLFKSLKLSEYFLDEVFSDLNIQTIKEHFGDLASIVFEVLRFHPELSAVCIRRIERFIFKKGGHLSLPMLGASISNLLPYLEEAVHAGNIFSSLTQCRLIFTGVIKIDEKGTATSTEVQQYATDQLLSECEKGEFAAFPLLKEFADAYATGLWLDTPGIVEADLSMAHAMYRYILAKSYDRSSRSNVKAILASPTFVNAFYSHRVAMHSLDMLAVYHYYQLVSTIKKPSFYSAHASHIQAKSSLEYRSRYFDELLNYVVCKHDRIMLVGNCLEDPEVHPLIYLELVSVAQKNRGYEIAVSLLLKATQTLPEFLKKYPMLIPEYFWEKQGTLCFEVANALIASGDFQNARRLLQIIVPSSSIYGSAQNFLRFSGAKLDAVSFASPVTSLEPEYVKTLLIWLFEKEHDLIEEILCVVKQFRPGAPSPDRKKAMSGVYAEMEQLRKEISVSIRHLCRELDYLRLGSSVAGFSRNAFSSIFAQEQSLCREALLKAIQGFPKMGLQPVESIETPLDAHLNKISVVSGVTRTEQAGRGYQWFEDRGIWRKRATSDSEHAVERDGNADILSTRPCRSVSGSH